MSRRALQGKGRGAAAAETGPSPGWDSRSLLTAGEEAVMPSCLAFHLTLMGVEGTSGLLVL